MDTITQAILGAAIGEAGFRHRLGGKAVVFGALCGLFPDLDMVVGLSGRWAMLIHHRGISHSLFFLLLMTPLLAWIGYLWARREKSYLLWAHLAFWALITHPLLDITTSYGTQILSPFSDRRFAIDAVSIIDPLYTLPLCLALVIGLIPKFSPRLRRGFAIAMLAFTTGYLAVGYCQSRRAVSIATVQLQESGFHASRVRALPTMFNIWLWRVVARDDEGTLQVGMLSTVYPGPIAFEKLVLPKDALLDQTMATEKGKIFRWFAADFVSARVVLDSRRNKVYLFDQRYGLVTEPARSIFGACAEFDCNGRLVAFELSDRPRQLKISAELSLMWRLLFRKME